MATKACPHCKATLIPHEGENPFKPVGSMHCDRCGCCFGPDGKLREGTPACNLVVSAPVAPEPASSESAPPSEEAAEESSKTAAKGK